MDIKTLEYMKTRVDRGQIIKEQIDRLETLKKIAKVVKDSNPESPTENYIRSLDVRVKGDGINGEYNLLNLLYHDPDNRPGRLKQNDRVMNCVLLDAIVEIADQRLEKLQDEFEKL